MRRSRDSVAVPTVSHSGNAVRALGMRIESLRILWNVLRRSMQKWRKDQAFCFVVKALLYGEVLQSGLSSNVHEKLPCLGAKLRSPESWVYARS